ncbi:homeobox protein siamois-like [Pelodytes ibericus]
MERDTELDQVLSTALSLEEDYPEFYLPTGIQDKYFPITIQGSSTGLYPTWGNKGPVQDTNDLEETLVNLYSLLGIPQEVSTGKYLEAPAPRGESNVTTTRDINTQHSMGIKRPFIEEEFASCKRPRVETAEPIPSASIKKSRKRTDFTKDQTCFLMNHFALDPYPDFATRCYISQIIGKPEPRIQVWFQNRRARHLPKPRNNLNP